MDLFKRITIKHGIFLFGAILIVGWGVTTNRPIYMSIAGFGFWTGLWRVTRDYGWKGLICLLAYSLSFFIGVMTSIRLDLSIPSLIILVISILAGFMAFEVPKHWDLETQASRWWLAGSLFGLWIGLSLPDGLGSVILGLGIGIIFWKILPWLRRLRW